MSETHSSTVMLCFASLLGQVFTGMANLLCRNHNSTESDGWNGWEAGLWFLHPLGPSDLPKKLLPHWPSKTKKVQTAKAPASPN